VSDDGYSLELFVSRLKCQCERARVAFRRLEALVRSSTFSDTDDVWEAVDSLMSQSGKVSRFFQPGTLRKGTDRAAVEKRAERLRGYFEVGKDSLLCRRTVRDHLDHFDERLQGPDPSRELVAMGNIGSADSLSIPNARWLDHFDPETFTVSYGKDRLDLRELANEISNIEARARAAG
jgi:hypothetical protein